MRPSSPPPILILAAGVIAGAGSANAGGSGCAPCSPPPPPPCNCAPTTHQVTVPGVSVTTPSINVGLAVIGFGQASSSASANADAAANASAIGNVSVNVSTTNNSTSQNTSGLMGSFGGSGSGSWTPEGGVTTDIADVKVQMLQPPAPPAPPPAPVCLAWRASVQQVAVQAVCIDDKATPHPASQVSPDRQVADAYEGEVFRCIAGTRMQYTMAEFVGQTDFAHGQTVTCQKGEALYHSATGALQCRPQTPARDCNERSLLRRFGAGVKVMAVGGRKVCASWGPAPVAIAPPPPGPAVLN